MQTVVYANLDKALDWVFRQCGGDYEVRYNRETQDMEVKNSKEEWVTTGYKYIDGWIWR